MRLMDLRVLLLMVCLSIAGNCNLEKSLKITHQLESGLLVAKVHQKPLLLCFLGGRWCLESARMLKEIIDSNTFSQMIGNRLITVLVDLNVEGELAAQFEEKNALIKKFHVDAFPRFILVDSELNELTRFGAFEGDAVGFANCLLGAIDNFNQIILKLKEKQPKDLIRLYQLASKLGSKYLKDTILNRATLQETIDAELKVEEYIRRIQEKRDPIELAEYKKCYLSTEFDHNAALLQRVAFIDYQNGLQLDQKEKTVIDSMITVSSKDLVLKSL